MEPIILDGILRRLKACLEISALFQNKDLNNCFGEKFLSIRKAAVLKECFKIEKKLTDAKCASVLFFLL